jgi:hypothetical protein
MSQNIDCSCSACVGNYPTLDQLPRYPGSLQVCQWFRDAGRFDVKVLLKLRHFCDSNLPATKQMIPLLLALLHSYHTSDEKLTQWYYTLQICIQNYFKTEGSCLFLGDAKEILSGELQFDMSKHYAEMAAMANELNMNVVLASGAGF